MGALVPCYCQLVMNKDKGMKEGTTTAGEEGQEQKERKNLNPKV